MDADADGAASPPLNGFFYQADASAWIALDLILAKRSTDRVTLEPPGHEDLEADLQDEAEAGPPAKAQLTGYRFIVQVKLRNTGPWDLTALKALVEHGKRRTSVKQRLTDDPSARYLLVTSAGLQGTAMEVGVSKLLAWPGAGKGLPPSLGLEDAKGRFAVLAGEDDFKIERHLRELLEDAFQVPHAQFEAAKAELRQETLDRMRRGGDWTRAALEALIRRHGGSVASSPELERFVAPINWAEAQAAFAAHNVIVLTGASGTGKTLAAAVLAQQARRAGPGASVVEVSDPRQIRNREAPGPVVFMLDDPWGKYQIHPDAQMWTQELPRLLAGASGTRRFIITSRTDILQSTHGAEGLQTRWNVRLEAQHYGAGERGRIYDQMLRDLPRHLHGLAFSAREDAVAKLTTPLELANVFTNLAAGPDPGETDRAFVGRCIARAGRDGLEAAIADQVRIHDALAEAAVLWALMKARPQLSRAWLPRLADALAADNPRLADGLDRWINIGVAARSLRQSGEVLTYAHNRVENGLIQALRPAKAQVRQILGGVAKALIALDQDHGSDWGSETVARMIAAARPEDLAPRLAPTDQARLDAWLRRKAAEVDGQDLAEWLEIIAQAASLSDPVGQLATWLSSEGEGFGHIRRWRDPKHPDAWFEAMATVSETAVICATFVRKVLPFERTDYPEDFGLQLLRLAPSIGPVFLQTAEALVRHGYLWNAKAIARAALGDLSGFERVVTQAVDFGIELYADQMPSDQRLALINGEYDEDHAEHLTSGDDEGDTASTFVEAYVEARRARDGWEKIAGHPRAPELLWAWLKAVGDETVTLQPGETDGLWAAAKGHRHEDRFWDHVARRWEPALGPLLLTRLTDKDVGRDARRAAITGLATAAPQLLPDLLERLAESGDARRLFELALDLESVRRTSEITACGPVRDQLIDGAPEPGRSAALALLGKAEPTPDALTLLRGLEAGPDRTLMLARARVLAQAGDDVRAALRDVLDDPSLDYEAVAEAERAITIAIDASYGDMVEPGLQHRLAAVRRRALVALGERSDQALPPSLLKLAEDRSSGVRRSLVDLLGERPAPAHTATLVTLCGDRWEGYGSAYTQHSDLPIARAAATALAGGGDLTPDQAGVLGDLAARTDDPRLRELLLQRLADIGGASGRQSLLKMALETNRGYHAAAADALAEAMIPREAADAIEPWHILQRPGRIAAAIARLVGRNAGAARLAEIARTLADHPDRKALLIALHAGAMEGERPEAGAIAAFLPEPIRQALAAAYGDGPGLRPEALHDISDERVLRGLIASLPHLFEGTSPPISPPARLTPVAAN